MLKPSDITNAGPYWYFADMPEAEPQLVEIRSGEAGLEVHFAGRDDYDLLEDVSGHFEGPLQIQPL